MGRKFYESMDLPSHILWTYILERVVISNSVNSSPKFVLTSLFFAALPDILESTPFIVYLALHRKKYGLKNFKSIFSFVIDITHNKQDEYDTNFPWAAKISFYTHSFLMSTVFALLLLNFSKWLFFSFLVGYGFHLLADVFLHKDYFSSRPFYPLNNFSIHGFVTWYKIKIFSRYNYGLLLITYYLFLWLK